MKKIICLSICALSSLTFGEESKGWQLSAGLITQDIVNPDHEKPFFPSFEIDDKEYMAIANIQYLYNDWTFGLDGITWEHSPDEGLSKNVHVGYPASGAGIEGKVGWLNYGLSGNLNYGDGLISETNVQLGPSNYTAQVGLGDRSDDLSQLLSVRFPLYIAKSEKIFVLGKGYLQLDNSSYLQNNFGLDTPIRDKDYLQKGLNVFGVFKANERTTFVISGTLQWNDKALEDEIETLPKVQFNIFSVLTYYFGQ